MWLAVQGAVWLRIARIKNFPIPRAVLRNPFLWNHARTGVTDTVCGALPMKTSRVVHILLCVQNSWPAARGVRGVVVGVLEFFSGLVLAGGSTKNKYPGIHKK